ncbi:MAG TPA: protein kinase, partial [Gemmatimonadaceae bacterium]|nr:protein kinase [Gemmatimonadaceae bacterium]
VYQIERELGGGGMSHVFLATERSLGRRVVIKVLPPEMVSGVSEARFTREILVTANLQHPNVLPVLTAGAKGDIHYFVTPFVEGQSLRERLSLEGPLPVADGVQILSEITSALGYAHSRGIIHRDIKPENILLSEGHAVLADFGIAAACQRATNATALTLPGQSPGTPGYMAPEQIVDPTSANERVDVYALGVVAYELFAGKKPFSGRPNAFFTEPAPSLTVPGLPRGIAAAISQALSPDPAKRFADAAEFHAAIRSTQAETRPRYGRRHWQAKIGGAVLGAALLGGYLVLSGRLSSGSEPNERASDRKMLAVLPFKNLGRPEDAYFADGVTEEVTSRLAMLSGLGVISRTSADQYANSTKPLKVIARELGADYVLEGSVRLDRPDKGPGRVRVTPQLIRVRDDTHLWSFPYEGEVKDVFSVQSQIAEKVAGALVDALPGTQREMMAAKPTENLAAYDAYMQGERIRSRESSNLTSLVRAEKLLLEATTADPRFALAFAKLALLHLRMYESFMDHSTKRLAAARAAADSAVALDASLPEGHLALGAYFDGTDDLATAAVHYAVAEKAKPNDAITMVLSASAAARGGAWKDALVRFARAAELDPRATRVQLAAAEAFGMAREYGKALSYIERAIAADSDNVDAFVMKTRLTMGAGDWPRAREIGRRIIQRFGADRSAGTEFFDAILPALDTTDLVTLERVPLSAFAGNKVVYHFWRTQLFERWQPQRARAHADTLWREGQPLLADQQNNRIVVGGSAWTNAFLGNRATALEYARRALELATRTRDAYAFAETGQYIAYTYLRLGEHDKALDVLDQLLRSPSWLSTAWLKNDPLLAPLKTNPRFQQLLASGA